MCVICSAEEREDGEDQKGNLDAADQAVVAVSSKVNDGLRVTAMKMQPTQEVEGDIGGVGDDGELPQKVNDPADGIADAEESEQKMLEWCRCAK